MITKPALPAHAYTIGIICVLKEEKAAMDSMLDEEHNHPPKSAGDDNSYTFGKICYHNVVIACFPGGSQGKVAATAVAMDMMKSFPIRFGLMVGIGGGVPSEEHDIRLGDVVVGLPQDTHGGVVQYDLGRLETGGFVRKGHLDKPPKALLSAINSLCAKHERATPRFPAFLSAIAQNPRMAKKYGYPGAADDHLFKADDEHLHGRVTCKDCLFEYQIIKREQREHGTPEIFYGTIGSGDLVMKSGTERDSRAATEGVICFEMEASGLMNHFPCVVIRGISDYADSHKNNRWQPYAAATAAAYAKELLSEVVAEEVKELATVHEKMLSWISQVNYSSVHEYFCDQQVPGTGQWLWKQPQYDLWRSSEVPTILLLHGIPGCGKTILFSALVERLREERHQRAYQGPIAYFYCRDDQSEVQCRKPNEILCSVVKQLASSEKKARDILVAEYQRRRTMCDQEGLDMTRPGSRDCEYLIVEMARATAITILIDGLDEVEDPDKHEILEALINIKSNCKNVARMFATSRDHNHVLSSLSDATQIRIQSHHNRDDLEKFTRLKVGRLLKKKVFEHSELDIEHVTEVLMAKAGEMFQWIVHQLDRFRGEEILDIDQMIRSLRASDDHSLYDTYMSTTSKLFQGVTGHDNLVLSTICWLLYAREPLTLDILGAALKTSNITIRTVLAKCLYLIKFDYRSGVFRIAHLSIKQFLQKQPVFSIGSSHHHLARLCLMTCNIGPPPPRYASAESLYRYGAMYWAYHYKCAESQAQTDGIAEQLRAFVFATEVNTPSLAFCDWLDSCKDIVKALPVVHPQRVALAGIACAYDTPLFAACTFNLESILEHMALSDASDIDWNQANTLDQTGKYLASASGNKEVVEYLLAKGADPNIPCKKHGSALAAACYAGYESIVSLLLTAHATCEPCGKYSNVFDAALRGDQETTAIWLLENVYRDLNQEISDTVHLGASRNGWIKVLRLLKQRHDDGPKSLNQEIEGVKMAISGGSLGSVYRFLERHASSAFAELGDAICLATLHDHAGIVEMLIEHGFDVEYEGPAGSPLRVAALLNRVIIAKVLLAKEATVDACGRWGTALQAAAMKGHSKMTNMLLKAGADPNLHGSMYGNALQAAAYHGHTNVVLLLLHAHADVRREGFFSDSFHAAVEGGHVEVMGIILRNTDYKLRVDYRREDDPRSSMSRPESRSRALVRSTSASHHGTVGRSDRSSRLLGVRHLDLIEDSKGEMLSVGLDPSPPSRLDFSDLWTDRKPEIDKNSVLLAAASKGHADVVSFLLKQRKALGIPDKEVEEAFEDAARQGLDGIVQLFLETISELDGPEALRLAAAGGHISVVSTILRSSRYASSVGSHEIETMLSSPSVSVVSLGLEQACKLGPTIDLPRLRNSALLKHAMSADRHDSMSIIVDLLLRVRPNVCASLGTKLFEDACASGNITLVIKLWETVCQEQVPVTILHASLLLASLYGRQTILHFLLQQTSLRYSKELPRKALLVAAAKGHLSTCKLLHVAMMEMRTHALIANQALIAASAAGHPCVAQFFIDQGADVNGLVCQSILADLAEYQQASVSDNRFRYDSHMTDPYKQFSDHPRLEDKKSQVNPEVSNNALQACLKGLVRYQGRRNHYMAYCQVDLTTDFTQREQILHILLEAGADPNIFEESRHSPLNLAACYGTRYALEDLISHGASVEASNVGQLALRSAASRDVSSFALVKTLLDTGLTVYGSGEDVHPVLDIALNFFADERAQEYFHGCDDLDGRFETDNLQHVFDQGPGAVVDTVIRALPNEKARDHRYGFVLQMASFLGLHSLVKLLLDRGVDPNSIGYYYGTALQAAARCGHIRIAQLLVVAGADVNILQGRHQTALRAGVVGGHAEVIKLLIQNGADPKLRPRHEQAFVIQELQPAQSILRLAVQHGDPDIVRCILNAGADVSDEPNDQRHSIFYACEHGKVEIVRLLVSAGSSVNITGVDLPRCYLSSDNFSLLHKASSFGKDEVVRYLLAEKSLYIQSSEFHSPLALAAGEGHASTVRLLLEQSAYTGRQDVCLALQGAASFGREQVIGEFIRWGVHDSELWSTLERAIKSHRVSIVKLLMRSISEVSLASNGSELCRTLEYASEQDLSSFKVLLRYAKVDGNALVYACRSGSLSAVRICLEHSVNPDRTNGDGHRGLHIAAYHLHSKVVIELISRGADVNFVDPELGSPLVAALDGCLEREWSRLKFSLQYPRPTHLYERSLFGEGSNLLWEAENQDMPTRHNIEYRKLQPSSVAYISWGVSLREGSDCEDIVRYLLDHGAMVDSNIGPFGNALHLASFLGHTSLVCLLLDRGADVNASGGFFQTALFAALEKGNADVANLLVKRQSRIDYCPEKQTTPLHLACSKGLSRVIPVLVRAGADVNAKCAKGFTALRAAIAYDCHNGYWGGGRTT